MLLHTQELIHADVRSVREVQLHAAVERIELSREFYTDVFGLAPWPEAQQLPGGLGIGAARRGIYLQYRHDPVVDPTRVRCSLTVSDLEALARRLERRSIAFERVRGFYLCDDCLVLSDPSGHRIAVWQSRAI